jgi:GntR family transcriptional regulator / MocR family aminotransferase
MRSVCGSDAETDVRGRIYVNAGTGPKDTRTETKYVFWLAMTKHIATLPNLRLDAHLATPLHHQLYNGIRAAILAGQLAAHTRLPASRSLAQELGISRNTVMEAYAQLLSEGYIEGKIGSGTYVTHPLPDTVLELGGAGDAGHVKRARSPSQRGKLLASTPASISRDSGQLRAFRPGLPAFDTFPFDIWARLMARYWRQPPAELLSYGDPTGYPPLREAIAEYLLVARGVRCTPEQIVIVAGSQQGLDLAARVLLDPGDKVWMEDPGYMGARGALKSAGAELVPVPVDQEGLNISQAIMRCATARLVYVTPSHQFPLGVTMSLSRRLALLDWAHHVGAWILEDDYDSEYRYTGRPLPALQGLDTENRTVYLGTLSKTLFPSLRLGYIVVPADLADAFTAAKALVDRHAPSVEQAVLATFITEGHFARHIRRTRILYAERQAALLEAAAREFDGQLDVKPAQAGMHLVGYLPEAADDQAVSRAAAVLGVEAPALFSYALAPLARGGLLLGYTAFTQPEIAQGVHRLAQALRSQLTSR